MRFLELGHQRVSLGKTWAICQIGRWPMFLDPNSQPFLIQFHTFYEQQLEMENIHFVRQIMFFWKEGLHV